MKKIWVILFLFLLAPIMGEVLSGSIPPLLFFFNPLSFLSLALLYGCGALLIREAKVRWKLQWSVIFLAIAYGILEEGTMIQSFFNLDHVGLDNLSGFGMFLGVQWPWTIMLILAHATLSILLPISITGMLWPEYKDKPLFKKKGLIITFAGLIFIVAYWMIFVIGQKWDEIYANYNPSTLLISISLMVVFLFIWMAYKYRNSRLSSNNFIFPPFIFGVFGFLFQVTNVFLPDILADTVSGMMTVLTQIIFALIALLFIVYQIYNKNITKRHIVSLIFGSVLFWIVLTPINEFFNGVFGISLVGIVGLVLLILWRRKVLK